MAATKCSIQLTSNQKMHDEAEKMVENYEGSYMQRGTKHFLSYKRCYEDATCTVLIAFDGNEISITQSGDINSKLTLIPRERTVNEYGSAVGVLSLEVFTREFKVFKFHDRIEIKLDYDMIMGGDSITTNMHIIANFI